MKTQRNTIRILEDEEEKKRKYRKDRYINVVKIRQKNQWEYKNEQILSDRNKETYYGTTKPMTILNDDDNNIINSKLNQQTKRI